MAGYGYTAIAAGWSVAWLARLDPLMIAVAALCTGRPAGRLLEALVRLDLQVPAAFGEIMEGLILFDRSGGRFFHALPACAAERRMNPGHAACRCWPQHVRSGTPILFATLGGILARAVRDPESRGGGDYAGRRPGGLFDRQTHRFPRFGIPGRGPLGAALAGVHGLVCLTFLGNQVVSGLALTILGTGLANYLGTPYVGQEAPGFKAFALPLLSKVPLLGPILFNQDPLVYTSYLIPPLLWVFLHYTRWVSD